MFLSIPSFLILSHNISDLLLKIVGKKEKNHKNEKNFELLALIGVISFFFVIEDFEQTIGGYILFWKLSFLSLIFSILCVLILSYFYDFNKEKRFYNILGIGICFFFLVPNIGIFINKHISKEGITKKITEINYKKISHHSKGGVSYQIFIQTEYDKNERLDIKKEFYESITNNQIVELTLKKGILGYNYVEKIKKIENIK